MTPNFGERCVVSEIVPRSNRNEIQLSLESGDKLRTFNVLPRNATVTVGMTGELIGVYSLRDTSNGGACFVADFPTQTEGVH